MKRTLRQIWLVLVGLVFLVACTAAPPTPAPTVTPLDDPSPTAVPDPPTATPIPLAATVNGEPITLAEYERQIARYEASMVTSGIDPSTAEGQAELVQSREWVLNLLIEQRLIEQSAREAGVTVSDVEVDATIVSLREDIGEEAFNQWLAQEQLTLEDMREQLRNDMIATQMANQVAESVPMVTEHVRARHILVATEEEARQIVGQIQAGADFIALARTYSQDDSTRDTGGDLGYFPRGMLTSPEVEAAAFTLAPGQISDVVASDLGYHIVQVVEYAAEMEVDPENLRLLRDQAVRNWLEGLRASAQIERFISTPQDSE